MYATAFMTDLARFIGNMKVERQRKNKQ